MATADLSQFYNSKSMLKRKFDHTRALKRENDIAIAAVLKMAGNKTHEKADGTVIFCIEDCMMGTASSVGKYAGFQNELVKKVRELGYLAARLKTKKVIMKNQSKMELKKKKLFQKTLLKVSMKMMVLLRVSQRTKRQRKNFLKNLKILWKI